MNSCDDCFRLENRLHGASDVYVSLVIQHDKMIRDGAADPNALDDAMRKARRRRHAAARLLLAHRKTHAESTQPKTHVAGQS